MPQDRVAIYVDGFNLYHSINDLKSPHLKWVNLWKLGNLLIRPVSQKLVKVCYFSAFATFYQNTPDVGKIRRHRAFVRCQEAKGVECHMGNFAKRDWMYYATNYRARWRRREEKQTDVAIGVCATRDAFKDVYDTAFIVSCDADMLPLFREIKSEFPNKTLITVAPPGRPHHRDLLNLAEGHLTIKRSQLERALFGSRVTKNGATVAYRPHSYRLP